MTLEELGEIYCYYSDGNQPSPVVQDEFEYSEKSVEDAKVPNTTGLISVPSNFIFLGESVELKERLKKTVVDRAPVINAEKFAHCLDNFDKGYRWRIL